MKLRRHQAEMLSIAKQIRSGDSDITTIYASVTPGGGKSALPAILADTLIGHGFDLLVWLVPRASLRDQGESDYHSWASHTKIRAADNSDYLYRGTDGYVSTYQAVVANPALHSIALDGKRFILFLDEPHHILNGGDWHRALAPIMNKAALTVFASGTFARGDGQPIAGIRYENNLPVFSGPGTALIRYSRSDALRDGAIVPVHFQHIGGSAEWEQDGEKQSADTLSSGDYAAQALYTALRTEYALALLDAAIADWRSSRGSSRGKLLVVAPNIEVAAQYLRHIRRRGIHALMASSEDTPGALLNISLFKADADVLVTICMAYEGLSVPAVTHIACLTHIRSVPWLEQCFARANRVCPGKQSGVIYGPDDAKFREAIKMIEEEQSQALREMETREDPGEPGEGPGRPWINPIGSAAHIETGLIDFDAIKSDSNGGMPTSKAEKLLRSEIAKHIESYIAGKRAGSKSAYARIIYAALKASVGGKAREALTVDELAHQWAILKERWPLL